MKLSRLLALAALALCLPLAAFADSATFGNNDGTFSATSADGPLSLNGSFLTQISGLTPLVPDNSMIFNTITNNCATPGCLGSVSLTTGPWVSGDLVHLSGAPGVNSMFGPGGTFTVTGSGFVFTGTFASATWTCSIGGCNGQASSSGSSQWVFSGTLASGTLQIGAAMYSINAGGTVDITAVGPATVTRNGANTITGITWKDNSGTTSFASPVPEPGTLTLLGSGLIGLGMLAKRRGSAKAVTA